MTRTKQPWIKLRESLDEEEGGRIRELEAACFEEDGTALKLELDYKLAAASSADSEGRADSHRANEFLYYDGERLVGYLGLSAFGAPGAQAEANGMVHPEYRRQGIFGRLFGLAKAEWERSPSKSLLLLGDRKSEAGQAFLRGTGAEYAHSEYEMLLDREAFAASSSPSNDIVLRWATNADAAEIARQDAIYWGSDEEGADRPLPEEEEKRGVAVRLAELDGEIVGKVHLQSLSGVGGVYGLGVLPEYRGRGYGRAILRLGVAKLLESDPDTVLLQVASDNANALGLYESCGFKISSTMDYYEVKK